MNINTKKMQVFKRQEGVPLNPEKIKQTFLIWPLILGDLSKLGRFIKKKTFLGKETVWSIFLTSSYGSSYMALF